MLDRQADVGIEVRDMHGLARTRPVEIPSQIMCLGVEQEGADSAGRSRVCIGDEVRARNQLLTGDQAPAKSRSREFRQSSSGLKSFMISPPSLAAR